MQHRCFRVPDHCRKQGEAQGNNDIKGDTGISLLREVSKLKS
jgi:hypothetical protein